MIKVKYFINFRLAPDLYQKPKGKGIFEPAIWIGSSYFKLINIGHYMLAGAVATTHLPLKWHEIKRISKIQ